MNKFIKKLGANGVFATLLFVPVIISAFYYFIIASDIYVSESEFSIYKSQDSIAQLDGLSSLGLNIDSVSNKDLLIVKEFILSKSLIKTLQSEIDLKKIYSHSNVDSYSRLKNNPNNDEFLKYYMEMVTIGINRDASLITLQTKAFKPEEALLINQKIIFHAEKFINELSARIKEDSLRQAQKILKEVEQEIFNNKEKTSKFRQKNKMFDPTMELQSSFEFIGALQSTKAGLIADRSQSQSTFKNNSFEIKNKNKSIANIDREIEKTKRVLLKKDEDERDVLEKFEFLKLEGEFAMKKYELALFSLEETYRSMKTQGKYLVQIENPTLPDSAIEPRRMNEVLTVFFITFIGLSLAGLILSGIKDHMI